MIRKLQEGARKREEKRAHKTKGAFDVLVIEKDVVNFVAGISELHRSHPM